jgi:hypothetical protein
MTPIEETLPSDPRPWLITEQFVYTPLDHQSALLDLLGRPDASVDAPGRVILAVSYPRRDGRTEMRYRGRSGIVVARRPLIRRPSAPVWRARFEVPLHVVELHQGVFHLIDGQLGTIALPLPVPGELRLHAEVKPGPARVAFVGGQIRRSGLAATAGVIAAAVAVSAGGVAEATTTPSPTSTLTTTSTAAGTGASAAGDQQDTGTTTAAASTETAPNTTTPTTQTPPVTTTDTTPQVTPTTTTPPPQGTPTTTTPPPQGTPTTTTPPPQVTPTTTTPPPRATPTTTTPTTTDPASATHTTPSATRPAASPRPGRHHPPPGSSAPSPTRTSPWSSGRAPLPGRPDRHGGSGHGGTPPAQHPASGGRDHDGTAHHPALPVTRSAPGTTGGGSSAAPSLPALTGEPLSLDPFASGQLAHFESIGAGLDQPPAFLIPIYRTAARRYHLPWQILAAINAIETDYGRDLHVSAAGAIGWMQFEPATWLQYGIRVHGSGPPNPYDPSDAIFSAARYLAANGAPENLREALFAYNHALWYVDAVLWRARLIRDRGLSAVSRASGYALPLDARYMRTLGRTDDGVDIESAPDGAAVYSITPGTVTAVASDPSGFGPDYPVILVTSGPLAGRCIYYGHVAASLVQVGEHVLAGQPIAIMGHTGDAASLGHGHIEIGFSDGSGDPLDHHGATASTPAGDAMRHVLEALVTAFAGRAR